MFRSTGDTVSEILINEIVGKVATSNGGHRFGRIEDVVIDTETGELKYLLIRSEDKLSSGRLDSQGRTVVSFSTLKVTENYVMFS